jgi:hypothetical protein
MFREYRDGRPVEALPLRPATIVLPGRDSDRK